MRFSFDFAEEVPEHPIRIAGCAKTVREAREYVKFSLLDYEINKNIDKKIIRKLQKCILLVEPKITRVKTNSKTWSIYVG